MNEPWTPEEWQAYVDYVLAQGPDNDDEDSLYEGRQITGLPIAHGRPTHPPDMVAVDVLNDPTHPLRNPQTIT